MLRKDCIAEYVPSEVTGNPPGKTDCRMLMYEPGDLPFMGTGSDSGSRVIDRTVIWVTEVACYMMYSLPMPDNGVGFLMPENPVTNPECLRGIIKSNRRNN